MRWVEVVVMVFEWMEVVMGWMEVKVVWLEVEVGDSGQSQSSSDTIVP